MEKDEDGWCVNKDRPDGGGGTRGGNTGEGSEGDSITFLVRVDCRTSGSEYFDDILEGDANLASNQSTTAVVASVASGPRGMAT